MADPQLDYEAAAERIEAIEGISAAQHYAPPAHEFEDAPEMAGDYDAALSATEPLEQREEAQAETQSVSAASEIDPGGLNGTSLESAPDLRQEFDTTNGEPLHDPQADAEREDGSAMVLDDQPTPEPSNTTLEAEIVDREHFDQAWEQEDQNAQARQDAALEEAADRVAEIEAQSRDNQQEMGMG